MLVVLVVTSMCRRKFFMPGLLILASDLNLSRDCSRNFISIFFYSSETRILLLK